MSSSIAANWIYSPEALPQHILEQWKRLAVSSGQADPVCCAPAWNIAFHDVCHPLRRIFYMSAHDSLIIFGELQSVDGDIFMLPLEDSWMFGQPLLGKDAPALLLEAVDLFEREYGSAFPKIVLSGIQDTARETLDLFNYFSNRFSFHRYAAMTECSASLRGGLDAWLSRRSANHRSKLKKAVRKAEEAGVEFERVRPIGKALALSTYRRMLEVEKKSWKGIGACGMTESPSRELYENLLVRLSGSRTGLVIFARHNGEDAGFIFGGMAPPYYRGQQFSYIQELAHLSLGNLLQLEKIRWLCELGIERYDMGPISGPRMGYKAHWTEKKWDSETWLMRKRR